MYTETLPAQVQKLQDKAEALHRKNYLLSKGIDPQSRSQLAFQFPAAIGGREDVRHMPNDYCRSSLFTARNNKQPRKNMLRTKLFHLHDVEILYTGFELRAVDDELVWMQLVHYAKDVDMGSTFEFNLTQLLQDLDWPRSGAAYLRLRECISRLRATEVLVTNKKAYGVSGSFSMLEYDSLNDEKGDQHTYYVRMSPKIMLLFAGNLFTSHNWDAYKNLSPAGRRLVDYVSSHKTPLPLSVENFVSLCGVEMDSAARARSFAKAKCQELKSNGWVADIFVENDRIHCLKAAVKDRTCSIT